MKAKITVTDSLTEYFETIQKNMNENLDEQLRIMARKLVGEEEDPDDGFIAPEMSTDFNPNLYISGQEEDFWEIYSNSSQLMGGHQSSVLEIIYTGMRLHENLGDSAKVWSEFTNDYGRLGRDYAFFQETGLDPIAKSRDAKHKGAIATGVRASKKVMFDMTVNFVENILKEGSGYFFMPK